MSDISILPAPSGRAVRLVAGSATAEVLEYGAHVTSWVPDDGHGEALFTSTHAHLDGSAAIRGGVPVIFPQFGPGRMVKHGFARTTRWAIAATETHGRVPEARLALDDDERTRALWPHPFACVLRVSLDDGLHVALDVTNTGEAPFAFTGALHAYFRVADVEQATVHGLEGLRLRDQLARVETTEAGTPLRITGPVDRIYMDAHAPVVLRDGITGRRLRVTMSGFRDVVVWNPAEEGARAIDDLGEDEWRHMLCIEPAVAATPVEVAPGATWTGAMHVRAER